MVVKTTKSDLVMYLVWEGHLAFGILGLFFNIESCVLLQFALVNQSLAFHLGILAPNTIVHIYAVKLE